MHASGRGPDHRGVLLRERGVHRAEQQRSFPTGPTQPPTPPAAPRADDRSSAGGDPPPDPDLAFEHPLRRSSDGETGQPSIRVSRRTLVRSLIALAVLCVVTGDLAVSVIHQRADGRVDEAVRERAEIHAETVLAPIVTDELVRQEVAATARMRDVSTALKRYGGVAWVTVTTADGVVVWSDDPTKIRNRSTTRRTTTEPSSLTFGARRSLGSVTSPAAPSDVITFDTVLETPRRVAVIVSVAYPDLTPDHGTFTGDDAMSAAIAVAVLLTALAIVVYALSASDRSRRERCERQRLVERLASTSDAERRRIAGVLHDGAVQELVGVSLTLGAAATAAPPPLDTSLRELAATTRTAVSGLRSLLSGIYPVRVPPTGWVDGVADLIETLTAEGVAVHLDVPDGRCSDLNELLMLRVAREALRNVAAHARARSVTISVRRRGQIVRLVIVDDGVGFDQHASAEKIAGGHVGLQLVQDLACELGATLTVTSTPGSGTTVRLDVKDDR
jgi:two-component system NarL family sensor kinase